MSKDRFVVLLVLWSAVVLLANCAPQEPVAEVDPLEAYEGRWNVKEVSGDRVSSSWLEIKREGEGWTALFLHRGGHPMPADVEVVEGKLKVQMLEEEPNPDQPERKMPAMEGTLDGDMIQGVGTSWRDATFEWSAVRSPDRLEGSDREVTWGDPIELFNGEDMTGWEAIGNRESKWKAVDGIMVNEETGANIRTVQTFRDFKLNLEFKIPEGSNSGIYLRGRYESQVADDFGKEPYSRGVGGIYGQVKPSLNAAKPAGEWNTVEVTLIGYRVTVVVNGETTIDGQLIPGITGGALDVNETEPGPIMLQGDHGTVYYRNVVLTPGS
ncbi:MAG: DUF1080 domain-containing protein [Acidobacteriota bacterium]|nr:MAG: DUF1080 domain-containing protein [Acidobacteriota bacterium]